ncbi:hypothetical protein F444_13688 [Phytophthora nicotianae P1976]|uniref:Uncharacterized protein n=1 Tax=Phytophthora nicotianae P1976 TaxID=1317066 RepID=A0A080ZT25_PHYNI|nr:hypothetical protein F444_13688 [Phytophthora nicotianae P1976]
MNPVKNITGYTAAAGFPTMPATAYTPQLLIDNSGFGAIVGYSNEINEIFDWNIARKVAANDCEITLS